MTENSGVTNTGFKQRNIIIIAVAAVIIIGAVIALFYRNNQVVATVNGERITKNALFDAMFATVGEDMLDDLITRVLIEQEAKRLGLKATDADVQGEIDKIVNDNFAGDEEEFYSRLEQFGISLDSFKEDARLNVLAQKIAYTKIDYTEDDLKDFFTENQELFDFPDEVEARHILVDTEEEALAIIAELEQGGDFAELANEKSLDPGSKDKGGNLGFFTIDDMLPEFGEAAFALSIGGRSAPVETLAGYHVIELLDRKEGRAVDFAEVEEQVKEIFLETKAYNILPQIVATLKAEAKIDYR